MEEDIGRMEIRAKEMSGEVVDPRLKYNFNLDQSVSVWSDYMKVFVDENNIFSYDDYSHLNEAQPFDVFNYGYSVFKTYDYEEEIESKLHKITEQCDRLQGFQAFCDIDSGFAGIAEDMLSFVREEFPRAPISFFGFYGAPKDMTRKSKAKRILNLSLSMTTLSQLCSVYFPLSHKHWDTSLHFPYLKLEKEKKFHSSAIFAAAINTLTRPYRDVTNSYTMHQFTSSLATSTERNICTLEASFPLPLYYEQPLNTLLNPKTDPIYATNWMYPLTPNTTRTATVAPYSCSVVMRGVPPSSFTRSPDYSSPDQLLQHYLSNFSCPSRESFTFNNNVPWQMPITFPKFFSSSVSSDGLLETFNVKEGTINSAPVLVNAQTTKQSSNLVSLLANACKDIDIGTLPEFQLQKTELHQLHDNLQHIYDLYQS
uniref:DML1/Misato tubulin domain-containing protein n=1 Tax=Arcella intermedia TaxID=1963864 RepID=A0A6B2L440_9EUKA